MNVGETVNLTKTSHELFRSAVVDCNGGDIFFINALGGTAPKTFAYLDSDNKLIYKHNYEAENLVVKVTSDTRKVVINDRKTGWAGINYHGYLPRKLSDIQSILDKFVIGGINITSNSILGDADNAELNVKYFLSVPIDNTPETYGSLITIGGDVFFASDVYTNMVQGHPRALGYVGMSSAFDRLITKCVNSNYNYFAGMFMNGDD